MNNIENITSKLQFKTNRFLNQMQHGKLQKQSIQLLQRNKQAHQQAITSLYIRPNCELVSASVDRFVRVWLPVDSVYTLKCETRLSSVPLLIDQCYIFTSDGKVYDQFTLELLFDLKLPIKQITQQYVFVSQFSVYQFNSTNTPDFLFKLDVRVSHIASSTDLVAVSSSSQIYIYNKKNQALLPPFISNNNKGVSKLLFLSPNQLISCGFDSSVIVFSVNEAKVKAELTIYVGQRIETAFVIKGDLIVSLSDGIIKFYSINELQQSRITYQKGNVVTSIIVENGSGAIGDSEGEIELFEM
ncbi:WD40-repeat-containing_domain superfamily [Hexamita inflata]|uniref:WD40-repeat-containing domain superfamily n=1 Tax=Hexamita inflata TaxID=28002 RepID=A0AA86QWU6_9EUKA|nr:WD40-repeat-containing domain superfamily [Hexamita inflata]